MIQIFCSGVNISMRSHFEMKKLSLREFTWVTAIWQYGDCETLEEKKEFNNKWRPKQATWKQANKSKPHTHTHTHGFKGDGVNIPFLFDSIWGLINNFIYLFLAELGLCCFAQAFSSCGAQARHCSGLWSTALGRAGFGSRWMWAQQLQFPFSRAQAQ